MKIVQFAEKQLKGIHIRTSNAAEMNPATAKIGALHQEFDRRVPVNYQAGARVYAVYYDYESDVSGAYSVFAGCDHVEEEVDGIEEITLQNGRYLVFTAVGEVPQVVLQTWMKIWDYFAQADAPYQRAYTTDFEFYKSQTEVEIHIAIQ